MDDEQAVIHPASPFTASTAEAMVECAANIAVTGMPLPAGLRAAAQEADSWRLAAGLRRLATDLERGRSLDDCIANARRLPSPVAGLILAAQRTGHLGVTLAAWTVNRRCARQYWRSVMGALAYPALSVVLALVVYMFIGTVVIPPFQRMSEEFGLKLPAPTVYLYRTTAFGVLAIPLLTALIVLVAIGTRLFGGQAGWSCLVSNLPLVGRTWHWTGVAEMLRCLGLLVECRVPLPEALRLTADGVTDAYVAEQCRSLASRVDRGRSLTMALVDLRTLPLSIAPLVRWGEQHGTLDAALRSAAEMIENRLKLRTYVLAQVIPPLVFVLVGVSVASAVISLFLPLISLIQGLS